MPIVLQARGSHCRRPRRGLHKIIRDGHDSASGSIQDLSRSACWVPRRADAHNRRRHGEHRVPHRGPPAGAVAIGPETKALLPDAVTTLLGELTLKGRDEPVEVHPDLVGRR